MCFSKIVMSLSSIDLDFVFKYCFCYIYLIVENYEKLKDNFI